MEVKAKLKYLRMSPKKVRLVVDMVRGMDIEKAENQLKFLNKAPARPVLKLLQSAIANGINNFKLEKNNLYIKEIRVDQGPTLKRWRPRAFGRATVIRKRSSHISIILAERVESKKEATKKEKPKVEKPVTVKDYKDVPKGEVPDREVAEETTKETQERQIEAKEETVEPSKVSRKPSSAKEQKDMQRGRGFLKKVFSRKSG